MVSLLGLCVDDTLMQQQQSAYLLISPVLSLRRASLSDTVRLWKSLEQTKDYELLRASTEKFVLDPFKAKTMKDISDLSDLVEMQERMISW